MWQGTEVASDQLEVILQLSYHIRPQSQPTPQLQSYVRPWPENPAKPCLDPWPMGIKIAMAGCLKQLSLQGNLSRSNR